MNKLFKKLTKGLVVALATVTLPLSLMGNASDETYSVDTGAVFEDHFNNGRVDIDVTATTQTVSLENTDAQSSNTRAVYSQAIDLTSFEVTFTLDQISTDGAFRLSFLSTKDDFPTAQWGDGFGIYFWDETAWGHADRTSLRTDFYAYSKDPASANCTEAKAVRGDTTYVGAKFYVKVWDYDADNMAIHIYKNDVYAEGGTIAKSNFPANFDYKNCYMIITPDIDSSRPHSYESNVQLTFNMSPNPVALVAPEVTLNENVASWTAVDNAVKYVYKINNGEEVETTETSVTLNDGETLVVKAVGNGVNYSEGAWSNSVTYTAPVALDKVAVTLNENAASWTAVDNAVKYVYKINDGEEVETTETNVTLNDGETLVVKAVGDGVNYLDGEWSDSVTYTAPVALDKVAVTLNENIASWTAVDNAVKYVYKINDGEEVETTETNVTLNDGETLVVKAVGDGVNYLDGEWSDSVTYTAPEVPTDPDQGGDEPTDPDQGGDEPTNPDQGGDEPTNPDQGGDEPTNPDQGGDEPTNPDQGGDEPTNPDQGEDNTDGETTEEDPGSCTSSIGGAAIGAMVAAIGAFGLKGIKKSKKED